MFGLALKQIQGTLCDMRWLMMRVHHTFAHSFTRYGLQGNLQRHWENHVICHTDSSGSNSGAALHLYLGQYTSGSLYQEHWPMAGIFICLLLHPLVIIPREWEHASFGAFENRSSIQQVELRIDSQMNNGSHVIQLYWTSLFLQRTMSAILKTSSDPTRTLPFKNSFWTLLMFDWSAL